MVPAGRLCKNSDLLLARPLSGVGLLSSAMFGGRKESINTLTLERAGIISPTLLEET